MNVIRIFLFFSLFFFPFIGCGKEDEPDSISDSSYFACIWDKAPFSGFTDLVKYKGKYYCCFREGANHVPISSVTEYGKIRILSSNNGVDWVSAASVEYDGFDIRDPKLVVTPDNKLMLYYGCSSFINGKYVFGKTMVSFASDMLKNNQLEFNKSYPISIQNDPSLSTYFLWRVVWRGNKAYGVAYKYQNPVLVESEDGLNYKVVSCLDFIPKANEAGIQFLSTGDIVIVIRENGANGYIATAPYPYKEWDFKVLNEWINSPIIVNIDDELFVAGRANGGTSLFHINGKILEKLYTYPAPTGDCGYPGLLHVNDELWISYYASNSIFLSKMPLSKIFKKYKI